MGEKSERALGQALPRQGFDSSPTYQARMPDEASQTRGMRKYPIKRRKAVSVQA